MVILIFSPLLFLYKPATLCVRACEQCSVVVEGMTVCNSAGMLDTGVSGWMYRSGDYSNL